MQTHSHHSWGLRIATFLLAGAAAASAAYWVLKWNAGAAPASAAVPVVSSAPAADPQLVARLLGGGKTAVSAVPDSAASHFKLIGVVARRSNGYALIAVDGKPARPIRVGERVNEALLLHSVAPRSAALAASLDAPVAFTLELPRLSPP